MNIYTHERMAFHLHDRERVERKYTYVHLVCRSNMRHPNKHGKINKIHRVVDPGSEGGGGGGMQVYSVNRRTNAGEIVVSTQHNETGSLCPRNTSKQYNQNVRTLPVLPKNLNKWYEVYLIVLQFQKGVFFPSSAFLPSIEKRSRVFVLPQHRTQERGMTILETPYFVL